jgi:hypothetical protein
VNACRRLIDSVVVLSLHPAILPDAQAKIHCQGRVCQIARTDTRAANICIGTATEPLF